MVMHSYGLWLWIMDGYDFTCCWRSGDRQSQPPVAADPEGRRTPKTRRGYGTLEARKRRRRRTRQRDLWSQSSNWEKPSATGARRLRRLKKKVVKLRKILRKKRRPKSNWTYAPTLVVCSNHKMIGFGVPLDDAPMSSGLANPVGLAARSRHWWSPIWSENRLAVYGIVVMIPGLFQVRCT